MAERDYSVPATLLGSVLADLALLAQQHESEELTAVVQQLKQAADLHWGDRPERARWAWQAAMAQLQQLLEENPELRGQLVSRAEPVEEPSSRRSSRSIRKWSTRPQRHLPRIEGLSRQGGRAYEY